MTQNECRGIFISEFATLEKTIEFYLAKYFVPEISKQYEMIEIIIERLTFDAKRTALKTILDKKMGLKGFVPTNTKKYPSGKFVEELRKLQVKRNEFAHYHLADNIDGYCIRLVNFRDKTNVIEYTKSEFRDIINHIKKLASSILRDNIQ